MVTGYLGKDGSVARWMGKRRALPLTAGGIKWLQNCYHCSYAWPKMHVCHCYLISSNAVYLCRKNK